MVLVCPQCSARLQIDDAKAPSRPFSVRCPKCQTSVNHPAATADEPLDVPEPPFANISDSTSAEFERHTSAPPFKGRNDNTPDTAVEAPNVGMNEIAKLLAAALQQSDRRDGAPGKRPSWDRRKALVCASAAYRETIAESLANNNYEVFVAENLAQA